VESWKGVKKSCILNGFKKAEIYPYDDNTVDSDVESSDDAHLARISILNVRLTLMSNGCRSLVMPPGITAGVVFTECSKSLTSSVMCAGIESIINKAC
jgi:hypothetical protein